MTDGPQALPRDRIKHDLFPPIEPFETGFLEIDTGVVIHRLYWEQSGNPEGAPVVFLHGGPGAGASPNHRRFFDPEHYRIIILDQRGAGRSRPLGELRNNDPDSLIADLETLRQHLGLGQWHVFGGSWGSTLALIYAQAHPDRVTSLVLRGIFLMTKAEIDWFLYGMRAVFPDHWADFANFIPEQERGNLLDAYYQRLTDTNRDVWLPAARSWSRYESVCSTLLPTDDGAVSLIDETHALGLSRIEAHFFKHHLFDPENRILQDIDRVRQIPTHIIQGRYDIVCPPSAAYELHRHWPEASFLIVPDAGHSAMEPGIRSALVAGTQAFRNIGL